MQMQLPDHWQTLVIYALNSQQPQHELYLMLWFAPEWFLTKLSKLVYVEYNSLFTLQRQIAYILITQMPCDMVNKKLELQRIECATSYT